MVHPLYLQVIFRLQLVYQRFQLHVEALYETLQHDKAIINGLESAKTDMVNQVSNKIQMLNTKILENILKQARDTLTRLQKKGDYDIKKRKSEE